MTRNIRTCLQKFSVQRPQRSLHKTLKIGQEYHTNGKEKRISEGFSSSLLDRYQILTIRSLNNVTNKRRFVSSTSLKEFPVTTRYSLQKEKDSGHSKKPQEIAERSCTGEAIKKDPCEKDAYTHCALCPPPGFSYVVQSSKCTPFVKDPNANIDEGLGIREERGYRKDVGSSEIDRGNGSQKEKQTSKNPCNKCNMTQGKDFKSSNKSKMDKDGANFASSGGKMGDAGGKGRGSGKRDPTGKDPKSEKESVEECAENVEGEKVPAQKLEEKQLKGKTDIRATGAQAGTDRRSKEDKSDKKGARIANLEEKEKGEKSTVRSRMGFRKEDCPPKEAKEKGKFWGKLFRGREDKKGEKGKDPASKGKLGGKGAQDKTKEKRGRKGLKEKEKLKEGKKENCHICEDFPAKLDDKTTKTEKSKDLKEKDSDKRTYSERREEAKLQKERKEPTNGIETSKKSGQSPLVKSKEKKQLLQQKTDTIKNVKESKGDLATSEKKTFKKSSDSMESEKSKGKQVDKVKLKDTERKKEEDILTLEKKFETEETLCTKKKEDEKKRKEEEERKKEEQRKRLEEEKQKQSKCGQKKEEDRKRKNEEKYLEEERKKREEIKKAEESKKEKAENTDKTGGRGANEQCKDSLGKMCADAKDKPPPKGKTWGCSKKLSFSTTDWKDEKINEYIVLPPPWYLFNNLSLKKSIPFLLFGKSSCCALHNNCRSKSGCIEESGGKKPCSTGEPTCPCPCEKNVYSDPDTAAWHTKLRQEIAAKRAAGDFPSEPVCAQKTFKCSSALKANWRNTCEPLCDSLGSHKEDRPRSTPVILPPYNRKLRPGSSGSKRR